VSAYSALKALRYPERIAAIRRGEAVGPVHVQIILSDLCNQSCGFCAYRDPSYSSSQLFYVREDGKRGLRYAEHPERNYNPNRMLPTEKVFEVLSDCAELGVKAVQFTGGGEPTVHPDFSRIADYAHGCGLKWSLVTNGVRLGQRPQLVEACQTASWVRVSIDASHPVTYGQIRRVPMTHFYDAWRAVTALAKLDGPVVGTSFVVTPENHREVYAFAGLSYDSGAHNVRVGSRTTTDPDYYSAEVLAEAQDQCDQAVTMFDGGPPFGRYFRVYDRFSETREAPTYRTCGYQFFTTYVGGDQGLYRCCVYAYHPRGRYGSIQGARFRDVWLAQARADAMRDFDARGCERCSFNRINEPLAYALAEGPELHEEFV
jgi:MoaA/NifB/PqqE/SkfB family radical SAM enzyme